jgi:lysozyme
VEASRRGPRTKPVGYVPDSGPWGRGVNYREIAKVQLRIDEGVRTKVYLDSLGIESIGVGRNLRDKGLSMLEIDFLLENDLTDAERDARSLVVTFDKLTDARKAVLLNMALNLGRTRLAGFKRFLEAIHAEAWEQAAAEMLDSKWAAQTGDRAKRLAQQMREG